MAGRRHAHAAHRTDGGCCSGARRRTSQYRHRESRRPPDDRVRSADRSSEGHWFGRGGRGAGGGGLVLAVRHRPTHRRSLKHAFAVRARAGHHRSMTEIANLFTITLAQLNPTVGDIAGNATKARAARAEARAAGAALVVLPELFIAGYPPEDLVLELACQSAWREI